MICIRCTRDSTFPERSQSATTLSICPGCKGKFAFDIRKGDLLTDKSFQSAIEAVSGGGTLKWGIENLYYEAARRCRKKLHVWGQFMNWGCGFSFIGVLIGGLVLAMLDQHASPAWLLVPLSLAWVFAWLVASPHSGIGLKKERFEMMWARWKQVHGEPKGAILRPEAPAKPQREIEPDLADYSFDRAVICDRARTVDLLLANNFHFENNCAVLSFGGYPQQAFETVRAMLKKNPHLQVFALHDATVAGCTMASDLARDPAWFKGQKVIDIGLRPAHCQPFKGLWLPRKAPIKQTVGLSGPEAKWLSRFELELAAIRPEQILKRLYKAINKQNSAVIAGSSDKPKGFREQEIELDYDSGIEFDADSFSADAEASDGDGGGDGFG